jgi:mannose-6-phosphate isomerase-like protein (cupin superfamily)
MLGHAARLCLLSFMLAVAGCGHGSGECPPPQAAAQQPQAAVEPATAQEAPPAAMLDALFAGSRLTVALPELEARAQLAPGETFKIVEVGRDANSSHHIVSLSAPEPLHRHDEHDLLVVTLRGSGQMLLGDAERPIAAPSIVYVPRGTVHSMRPAAAAQIVGYAVFVPPFDGKDRVPADAPLPRR